MGGRGKRRTARRGRKSATPQKEPSPTEVSNNTNAELMTFETEELVVDNSYDEIIGSSFLKESRLIDDVYPSLRVKKEPIDIFDENYGDLPMAVDSNHAPPAKNVPLQSKPNEKKTSQSLRTIHSNSFLQSVTSTASATTGVTTAAFSALPSIPVAKTNQAFSKPSVEEVAAPIASTIPPVRVKEEPRDDDDPAVNLTQTNIQNVQCSQNSTSSASEQSRISLAASENSSSSSFVEPIIPLHAIKKEPVDTSSKTSTQGKDFRDVSSKENSISSLDNEKLNHNANSIQSIHKEAVRVPQALTINEADPKNNNVTDSNNVTENVIVKSEPHSPDNTCSVIELNKREIEVIDIISDDDDDEVEKRSAVKPVEPTPNVSKSSDHDIQKQDSTSVQNKDTVNHAVPASQPLAVVRIKEEPLDETYNCQKTKRNKEAAKKPTIGKAAPKFDFSESLKKLGPGWTALGNAAIERDINGTVPPCVEELDFYIEMCESQNRPEDREWIEHATFVKRELERREKFHADSSAESSVPKPKRIKIKLYRMFGLPDPGDEVEEDPITELPPESFIPLDLPDEIWNQIGKISELKDISPSVSPSVSGNLFQKSSEYQMDSASLAFTSASSLPSLSPAGSVQTLASHLIDEPSGSNSFDNMSPVHKISSILDSKDMQQDLTFSSGSPLASVSDPMKSDAINFLSTDLLRSIIEQTQTTSAIHSDVQSSITEENQNVEINHEINKSDLASVGNILKSQNELPTETIEKNSVPEKANGVGINKSSVDDDEDSVDTVINSPCHDSFSPNADNLSDDETVIAAGRCSPSSSAKKKTKFEEILERKELEDVKKAEKQSLKVTHIKDPRLASFVERHRQKEKKSVTVIKPLRMETSDLPVKKNTKGKSPQKTKNYLKKSSAEVKNDNVKSRKITNKDSTAESKSKDPRLNKRPRTDVKDAKSNRSTDSVAEKYGANRSGERFQYRGGFLAESMDVPHKKKRPNVPNRYSDHKRSLTMNELHAAADIPGICDIVPDTVMDTTPVDCKKKKIGISEYKNRMIGHQAKTQPQPIQARSITRDPRLDRFASSELPHAGAFSATTGRMSPVQGAASWTEHPVYNASQTPAYNYMHASSIAAPLQFVYNHSSRQIPYVHPVSYPTPAAQYLQSARVALLPTPPKEDMIIPPLPPPAVVPSTPPIMSSPAVDFSTSPSPRADFSSKSHSQIKEHTSAKRVSQFNASKHILLLPEPLKNAVGNKVVSEMEAVFIVLSYSVSWLDEQKSDADDPPPVYAVKKELRWYYANETDYFNTYISYLMWENWDSILNGSKVARHNANNFHFFDIKAIEKSGDWIEVRCSMDVKSSKLQRLSGFPKEGDLLSLKLKVKTGEEAKIFGYVNRKSCCFLSELDNVKVDLHVKIIYKIENLDTGAQVRLLVCHNLDIFKRQVQALKSIPDSPLRGAILCPGIEPPAKEKKKGVKYSCRHIVQERVRLVDRNASVVLKTVKQIMKGMSGSDDIITIVDTPAGADGLSTIISLIFEMKKMHGDERGARILVCTKSKNKLFEIALRLATEEDDDAENSFNIRLAINMLPKEILQELKKYSIEEIIDMVKKESQENDINKIYEFVLSPCDVILSPVNTCHSRRIHQAIGPKSKNPLTLCILHEAFSCTEMESITPLLYGIRKFVLFGDPTVEPVGISSKRKAANFYRSLAARVRHSLVKD